MMTRFSRCVVAVALLFLATGAWAQDAPERLDRGRFTFVFFPQDRLLARSLSELALATDTFPGFPRPRARIVVALAPDAERFREWIGPYAPEWGAAVAFPRQSRIVMQGRRSGGDAGDPREVLRHEIAHLVVHEFLPGLTPTWFDEGYASYAAHEWRREDALAANLALVFGAPTLAELDSDFRGGSARAGNAYALAYRAVAELAELHPRSDLTPVLTAWRRTGSLELALRNSYALTLDGFEKRFRERTRRRYGALALVGNLSVAGLLVSFVLIPLYIARRRRDRARLALLVAADAAADKAARESVLDHMLEGSPERPGEEPAEGPPEGESATDRGQTAS